MGSGSSKNQEPAEWKNAGEYKADPRDPIDDTETAKQLDWNAEPRKPNRPPPMSKPQKNQPESKQILEDNTKPLQQGVEEPERKSREFIRVGDRVDNRRMDQVKTTNADPKKAQFKPSVDKKKIRGVFTTDKVAAAKEGRKVVEWTELDAQNTYFVLSKPQMLPSDDKPYNKRPLPTPRRSWDIRELTEEEWDIKEQDTKPLEEQEDPNINIDGIDVDPVSYQFKLDPLPLLMPRKANVPREDFLGTACGQDILGVEDDGYARDIGHIPHGERLNLLRIINEY